MRTKLLLCLAALFLATTQLSAQSHKSVASGYNCKFTKNKKGSAYCIDCATCPACKAIEDKEKEARVKEDERRIAANVAAIAARKRAAEELRLKNEKLAREEANRKRDKEVADKVASENAQKRYKEIAAKGLIKSDVKGGEVNVDLSKVEAFKDDTRKIFGFRFNGQEVMTFPFDEKSMSINRIDGSNLFIVNAYGGENKYSYIMDITGKKIVIDGNYKSGYGMIEVNKNNRIIQFSKQHSKEYADERLVNSSRTIGTSYSTKEFAREAVKAANMAGPKTSYFFRDVLISFETEYTLDYNGKILKKVDAYFVR